MISSLPVIVVTHGMSLEQAVEAQERPVEGECFFLGAHCGKPTEDGDWLCPEHRAWTPNLGGTVSDR